LPGHGLSSHLPAYLHYTLLDYAFCVIEVVKSLGYDKLGLLSHSMGGFVAILLAALCGEQFSFSVQIDVSGFIPKYSTASPGRQSLCSYGKPRKGCRYFVGTSLGMAFIHTSHLE